MKPITLNGGKEEYAATSPSLRPSATGRRAAWKSCAFGAS